MSKTRLMIWVMLATLGFSSCIVVPAGPRRYGYGGGYGGYGGGRHYHGHHHGGHGCR